MARTNNELRSKGISAFVVERDTPGLSVGKKEENSARPIKLQNKAGSD